MTEAVCAIFDRIPALRALRGSARIEAEEVIENALADAVEDWLADAEGREQAGIPARGSTARDPG